MSRLVVVSNRVGDPASPAQAGGLAVALLDAMRETGGLWFGWDGNIVDEESDIEPPTKTEFGPITTATQAMSQRDYDEYYLGFCNSALWPVFHYRLDLARFSPASVERYRRVNARLAAELNKLIKPDDLIWVHDYHLIPLAAELRALGVRNRIGYFLHIPFPAPEILTATPENAWLLKSMLDYDLVGFQTNTDLGNFLRNIADAELCDVDTDGHFVTAQREVAAAVFPIGIDVDGFHAMATTPEANARIESLQRRVYSRANIIGVDRLDYTKGLPERMRGFGRLLELYPQNCKVATLMQIAAPTREDVDAYGDIRRELEGISGAINGTFGDFDWTPVRYINRSMPRETLAALYRGSQVGLVTPLRDGMNLVAKEYVAAQNPEDPGVLILSRFAGAAEELVEAILVNPYDADEMAEAMQQAIVMQREERCERHAALLARLREHDADNWRHSFIRALRQSGQG